MLVPVFWQTWWFRLSGVLAFIFALLAFHLIRLRQLTRRLNSRFEERLIERTRITQEIQDTLLQGVLSASMQLHVAIEQVAEDSPAKPRLRHVQQLMGQIVEEARNTIRGMRSSGNDSLDLGRAFDSIRQEFAAQEQMDFRVVVEGRPRPLHPIIRDEVYGIGREAVVNAFRQAGAKSIKVEMEYAARRLRVLISDDGCGMGAQTPPTGSDGRARLSSMRERAEGIGARLKVRTRAAAGTEVELSVPSWIAYLNQSPKRAPEWLARLSPRRAMAKLRKSETEEDR
jgi:signal transduction histidine kinase